MKNLNTGWLIAAIFLFGACRSPEGKQCQNDEQCGSGFDCYHQTCVRVCTKNDDCNNGETCVRYHCATAEQGPVKVPAPSLTPSISRSESLLAPPTPDATMVELRAIRKELEMVRRDQQKLLQLLSEKNPKK